MSSKHLLANYQALMHTFSTNHEYEISERSSDFYMVGEMKKHVFVTRVIPKEGLSIITRDFETSVWHDEIPPSKEEIIQNARHCDGMVTLLTDQIDAEIMDSLPNLKVIAQYAVGYDNIDLEYATSKGIIITNTPGVLTETTADLTWALILSASRRIVEADAYVRAGRWKVAWGPELLLGSDIHGATLGIVGMGRIGKAVARRAHGFNMRILYTSRSIDEKDSDSIEMLHAKRVELLFLLKESDIVSLHVPLTPQTRHMIGKDEMAIMKPGAILINTSRGSIIDEQALYDALKSGHLGAAGLDVFADEPIKPENPLLSLTNIVIVPHIGSASTQTRSTMAKMCAENLRIALNGERPPNIVNPKVL
jgi:glyoxylate reductase